MRLRDDFQVLLPITMEHGDQSAGANKTTQNALFRFMEAARGEDIEPTTAESIIYTQTTAMQCTSLKDGADIALNCC